MNEKKRPSDMPPTACSGATWGQCGALGWALARAARMESDYRRMSIALAESRRDKAPAQEPPGAREKRVIDALWRTMGFGWDAIVKSVIEACDGVVGDYRSIAPAQYEEVEEAFADVKREGE
jgi:hypothetical protein